MRSFRYEFQQQETFTEWNTNHKHGFFKVKKQ